ncbi:MAG: VOC family protein [Thermomicrobiales bacterium]|nr:VOC family protein [Thermomicrobiales bacterium]
MALLTVFLTGGQAEEMANYYANVFPDGEVTDIFRTPGPDGDDMVVTASIRVNDTPILLINGPQHTPNESCSQMINCPTQEEVDHFWNHFVGDGGEEGMCGWCKDKFGFSWQVIPAGFMDCMSDPDPVRAGKAFQAMMTMKKLDIDALKAAMDS